ncbi:MAG: acetate uptake transporter [Methanomassiliicoccales archaeon]|nr:acetate uptake transporter [Methanomassiliicoccales archaeon]
MGEQPANKVWIANPAPLGLMAFGVTTVLLNLYNAGLFGLGSMILAMGIFYGGLAQVFAGLMEYRNGNTFGTIAFTSYGLFWLSLVALIVLPELGLAAANEPSAMAAYLFMWSLVTFLLFFGTLRTNKATMFVFASLALLFLLLGLGDLTGNADITHIAGVEGIIVGFAAIYTAIALVLNETFAPRTILPVGPAKPKKGEVKEPEYEEI